MKKFDDSFEKMNLEAKKNIDEISSQFECLKKSKVEFMKLNDEKPQFHSGNLILLLVAVIIINGSTIYYSITQHKNTINQNIKSKTK